MAMAAGVAAYAAAIETTEWFKWPLWVMAIVFAVLTIIIEHMHLEVGKVELKHKAEKGGRWKFTSDLSIM